MTNSVLALAIPALSLFVALTPLTVEAQTCHRLFRSKVEAAPERLNARQRLTNRFRSLSPVEGDMVYGKDADSIFVRRSPILAMSIRALQQLQGKLVSEYKTEDLKHTMEMSEYWFNHETRYGNTHRVDKKLQLPIDIEKYEGRLVYGTYLQYMVDGRPYSNRDFVPNVAYEKSESDPTLGQLTGIRAKTSSFMGLITSAQAIKIDGDVVLQLTIEDAKGQPLKLTSFNNSRSGDILSIHELLVY